MTPGAYDITMTEYQADPCEAPSLSASIIHRLLTQSPKHAWTAHPKLNPDYQAEQAERFDLGSAFHAFLLEAHGQSDFAVIDAPDWRTKDAQTRRDAARVAGKIPLLRGQWDQVLEMASHIGPQLARVEAPRPFTDGTGRPEQTLIWQESVGGHVVWCRARLDWLHDDHLVVDDLKTTSATANPIAWSRTLFGYGYDTQAAWYARGVQAVFGTAPRVRFVVVETQPPYAASVVALGPEALDLADKKITYALGLWADCLGANLWPGYPTETCYADVPPWDAQRWGERLYQGQAGIVDPGGDIGELLL